MGLLRCQPHLSQAFFEKLLSKYGIISSLFLFLSGPLLLNNNLGGVSGNYYSISLFLTINKSSMQANQTAQGVATVAIDIAQALLQACELGAISGSSAVNYHAPGTGVPQDLDVFIHVSKTDREAERLLALAKSVFRLLERRYVRCDDAKSEQFLLIQNGKLRD